ncbi:MAG: MerR family transcriptional regulator [Candidatus Nanopelagicales bacterium]
MGLVTPQRSGRYRLYSVRDIRRLEKVQQLTSDGLNLEGIRRVLDLEEELLELRSRLQNATRARNAPPHWSCGARVGRERQGEITS